MSKKECGNEKNSEIEINVTVSGSIPKTLEGCMVIWIIDNIWVRFPAKDRTTRIFVKVPIF